MNVAEMKKFLFEGNKPLEWLFDFCSKNRCQNLNEKRLEFLVLGKEICPMIDINSSDILELFRLEDEHIEEEINNGIRELRNNKINYMDIVGKMVSVA